MWITGEINGETVGTRITEMHNFGPGRALDAAEGAVVNTETYADVFETMGVRNDTGDDVMCKHCGDVISAEDKHAYEDDVCRGKDSDTHEWGPGPYAWFDEARVSLNEGPGDEAVTATLKVKGKRFRITVYLGEDGRLMITQNGTSGTAGATEHAGQTYTEMIIAD